MAARSQEAVAAALSTVLRDHGLAVASNARRLRASLSDLLGAESDEHRGALDAVLLVVDEGLVDVLRQADRATLPEAMPTLVARLGEWGLAPDPAEWALRTWTELLPAPRPATPLTAEPPATRSSVVAPTTLPPVRTDPTVLPPVQPHVPPPVQPTVLPTGRPPGPAHPTAPSSPRRRRLSGRSAAVAVGATAVVVVLGGVAAAMNWPDGQRPTGEQARTPAASAGPAEGSEPTGPPPRAAAGTVVAAPGTSIPTVDRPSAMGARNSGVRLARLGEVEVVGTGDEQLSAPEGGRLIAFRLADGPCERSCRSWSEVGLRVAVDGRQERLPTRTGSDTFVVAVPAGEQDVELLMKADGVTQSLSLVTGRPGRDNIAVLSRSGRVDRVGQTFTLLERTSQAFDYGGTVTDTVPRTVTMTRAELTYFTEHGRPSSPGSAFLRVRANYRIPYADEAYGFDVRELTFVARDGTTYRARDLDDGPGVSAMFEVPANLQGGVLRFGGTYATSSDGLPYTVTLASRSVRLRFG